MAGAEFGPSMHVWRVPDRYSWRDDSLYRPYFMAVNQLLAREFDESDPTSAEARAARRLSAFAARLRGAVRI
jgi:hypothetical protein